MEKGKLKTIIFDFDGTIADSLGIFVDVYNQLAEKYGYEKVDGNKIFRDHSTFELLTKVLKVPFYRLPFYYFEAKKIFKQKILEAKAFSGIKPVLDQLAEKYELGILTSNYEPSVQDFIKDENIDDFTFIFSNASTFGKHRDIKKLLKQKGLNKDEVVYVGDELRDIKSCKKIGVEIIAISWGFDSRSILKRGQPDYLIDRLDEIMQIIPTS